VYYWHGEYKIESRAEKDTVDGGISCYTSTDLINWNNVGLVMSVDYNNPASDIGYGCILERPKIIFNEQTKKFVAFFNTKLKYILNQYLMVLCRLILCQTNEYWSATKIKSL
jgi:hypothetical protein